MAEDETPYPCGSGYASGLSRRGVTARSGLCGKVVGIGGLVVEDVDTADIVGHGRIVDSVGAIGVAGRAIGRGGETVVGDDSAVGSDVVGAMPDILKAADGDILETDHVAAQMTGLGLLGELKAGTGHTVVERKGLDRNGMIFKNDGTGRRDYVVVDLKRCLAAENGHDLSQDAGALIEGVDGEGAAFFVKGKSGQQTGQAEEVVAVEMGYEDMGEARKLEPLTHHLELRALAAIDHEQSIAEVDDLTRRHMADRRRGRAAAENVDLKICHQTIIPAPRRRQIP